MKKEYPTSCGSVCAHWVSDTSTTDALRSMAILGNLLSMEMMYCEQSTSSCIHVCFQYDFCQVWYFVSTYMLVIYASIFWSIKEWVAVQGLCTHCIPDG